MSASGYQAGNIVVYQNLGQASRLDYRQTRNHLNILAETFICTEVKPFFRNRQKELSKNPKIFFYDKGFRNSLMENMNSLDKRPDSGSIIENTVFIRLNKKKEGCIIKKSPLIPLFQRGKVSGQSCGHDKLNRKC